MTGGVSRADRPRHFDASGGMAVVYGHYQLTENGTQRSGPSVTVYLPKGRSGKIRSQACTGR